jgi:hypothetical protein
MVIRSCYLLIYGRICTFRIRRRRPTSNISINPQKSSQISQTYERSENKFFNNSFTKQKPLISARRIFQCP